MSVLFLNVAMIRLLGPGLWSGRRSCELRLRRPLALMRIVMVRPAAAAPGAGHRRGACGLIRVRLGPGLISPHSQQKRKGRLSFGRRSATLRF